MRRSKRKWLPFKKVGNKSADEDVLRETNSRDQHLKAACDGESRRGSICEGFSVSERSIMF